jgi:hypothetical protein
MQLLFWELPFCSLLFGFFGNLASLDKEYPLKVAQLWIYVVTLYELYCAQNSARVGWFQIVLPTIWVAYAVDQQAVTLLLCSLTASDIGVDEELGENGEEKYMMLQISTTNT